MDFDSDLVAHCAGGDKEGRFAAEELRGTLLKSIDCGIFAEDVIADVGLGHGPSHRGRGLGHGIAA
jgi:hypothetical protein